ncbi:MAG: hypothetical protein GX846_02695 [Deltaproteobacteria bacterium]|nr:hypothetical protein [Deltaproteobacteria bacterium]
MHQSTNQPVNQSTSQPINQYTNQSINMFFPSHQSSGQRRQAGFSCG